MAQVELIMPKMGESIMEATILKWLKQVGDPVELDEPLLEIATDKVDSEVPSPVAGTVIKLLYQEGDTVEIDKAIAIIGTEGESADDVSEGTPAEAPAAAPADSPVPQPVAAPAQAPEAVPAPVPAAAPAPVSQPVAAAPAIAPPPAAPQSNGTGRFYSPLVLNIARRENISMTELEIMPGTGKDGRVSKKDILAYIQQRNGGAPAVAAAPAAVPQPVAAPAAPAPAPTPAPTPAPATADSTPATAPKAAPAASVSGDTEIIEMDRMRKLIADHMVRSKQTSPHVTSFVEADMTAIVHWRNKIKRDFQERHGEKLTFTPIFVEAIVKAIQDFPMVNVSVEGNQIIRKKSINIGMATALPSGNLIVPVIKNADQFNMVGLAKQVNDLAARARAGKLQPSEIEGGTYSITNVGTFGNVMGTPIINQPQVAIMAFGAIRKKPAVIETPQGDFIGIRHMMFLSHSYDHRVVDGMMGGSFLRRVADYLEAFDTERDL